MNKYFNPESICLEENLFSGIGKEEMDIISFVNDVFDQPWAYVYLHEEKDSKSLNSARILVKYYCKKCKFENSQVVLSESYKKHLNCYNVIYIDISEIINRVSPEQFLDCLKKEIYEEVVQEYDGNWRHEDLFYVLMELYADRRERFIFIIENWDAPYKYDGFTEDMLKRYSNYLGLLLKDKSYVLLAYITGTTDMRTLRVFPAMNMFDAYTREDMTRILDNRRSRMLHQNQ